MGLPRTGEHAVRGKRKSVLSVDLEGIEKQESGLVVSMRCIGGKVDSLPVDLIGGGTNGPQLQVLPRRESGPGVVMVAGTMEKMGQPGIQQRWTGSLQAEK